MKLILTKCLSILVFSIVLSCGGEEGTCLLERDIDVFCIEDADKEDCKECSSVDDCACSDFADNCGDGVADFYDYSKDKSCKDLGFTNECKEGLYWQEHYDCDEGRYF